MSPIWPCCPGRPYRSPSLPVAEQPQCRRRQRLPVPSQSARFPCSSLQCMIPAVPTPLLSLPSSVVACTNQPSVCFSPLCCPGPPLILFLLTSLHTTCNLRRGNQSRRSSPTGYGYYPAAPEGSGSGSHPVACAPHHAPTYATFAADPWPVSYPAFPRTPAPLAAFPLPAPAGTLAPPAPPLPGRDSALDPPACLVTAVPAHPRDDEPCRGVPPRCL